MKIHKKKFKRRSKRSDVVTHKCTDNCRVMLIERAYNPINKWDLRCFATNRHIKWLNTQEAEQIWDMVPRSKLTEKKKTISNSFDPR